MGRTTFESFPKGALPGRQNIVVTRNADYHPENVTIAHSIADAIDAAEMPGEVMIIGGAQIYAATIDMVSTIYLTRVDAEFPDADTFSPPSTPTSGRNVVWSTTKPTTATPCPTLSSL